MSRILIVGGAGYIGGLTTDYLISNNEVLVYDNLLYENRYLKPVNFVNADLRDTKALARISADFDTIILLAALVGDPACSANQSLTQELNYQAIKRACKEIPKDKHIIFTSTCSVYGAQEDILDEKSPTNPLSSYASTKLAAEKHVLARGGTVFRLGTVYGLGDNYSRIRMDLVINYLTMRAIKYGNITINGGSQYRPIISVQDVAKYISESTQKKPAGIFVVARQNIQIDEIGKMIGNIFPSAKIDYNEISFHDARNYRVNTEKARNYFNYQPTEGTIEDEIFKIKALLEQKRIKDPESFLYNNGLYVKEFLDGKTTIN